MPLTRNVIRAVLAAAVAGPILAYATTIDFSSLSGPGSTYMGEGTSYTQQGFTFSSDTLEVWQASSANLPGLSAANTSLFEFYADGDTTITAAGDAPFTLDSIDLAPLIAGGSGSFDVTFIGTYADSATVSQTFTVNDGTPPALQTFDFTDFTNVVKVSFEQGTNSGFFVAQDTAYQFDNVVVTASSTAVPEPRGLSLLAIGAAGLIGLFLKRMARLG
jgi:hypothetical protein